MLEDKQNALQSWLELYYSSHYQQKAESWIAGWCIFLIVQFKYFIRAKESFKCSDAARSTKIIFINTDY